MKLFFYYFKQSWEEEAEEDLPHRHRAQPANTFQAKPLITPIAHTAHADSIKALQDNMDVMHVVVASTVEEAGVIVTAVS